MLSEKNVMEMWPEVVSPIDTFYCLYVFDLGEWSGADQTLASLSHDGCILGLWACSLDWFSSLDT